MGLIIAETAQILILFFDGDLRLTQAVHYSKSGTQPSHWQKTYPLNLEQFAYFAQRDHGIDLVICDNFRLLRPTFWDCGPSVVGVDCEHNAQK